MSAYISWPGGAFYFDAVLQESHTLDSEITTHPVEQGLAISDNVRPNPKIVSITGLISQTPIYSFDSSPATTNPLDLYNPNHPPSTAAGGNGTFPPNTQTITPPQPPVLLSLNSAFNALAAYVGGGSFSLQTAQRQIQLDSQTFSAFIYQSTNQKDYIAQAYNVLRNLQASATIFTVFGGGGLGGTPGSYGGEVSVNGAAPTGAGNATAMFTNMVLKSIEFVREQGAGGSAKFTLNFHEIRIVNSTIVAAPTPTIVTSKPAVNTGSQAPVTPPLGPKFTGLGAFLSPLF